VNDSGHPFSKRDQRAVTPPTRPPPAAFEPSRPAGAAANPALLRIGRHDIGHDRPVFVIAEIGNNHNGDFDRAVALIEAAAAAGANCAKFQLRQLDRVYRARSLSGREDDLAVEYTLDILRRFELPAQTHAKLKARCEELGLTYLCTPWDLDSARFLEDLGVAAFKVASADMTNRPLLSQLAASGRPLIVSTGMWTLHEIEATVVFLHERAAEFALLHCQSTYPAAFANLQLRFLETLRRLHPRVGYSGHERGAAATLAAVALGAEIVERHITLDRGMEGPDHAASLEPSDFAQLVEGIREIGQAMGPLAGWTGEKRLSQGELINRENLAKSLVAARAIQPGQVITQRDVAILSPGQGLPPHRLDELLGRRARRALAVDDYFYPSDLEDEVSPLEHLRFRRPWGVPVRHHDWRLFIRGARPDFLEFHLSFKDLELKVDDYFDGPLDLGLVVHAPELFAGSHLMDLASPDDGYRRHSIAETQRVIAVTRELKRFFPRTERPLIVANIGGFSRDRPLAPGERPAYYARLGESLAALDLQGVELVPQTMTPFPWHFGGQRHQNLFVFPQEILSTSRKLGLRICLDVSHTQLAARHFGFDLHEAIELFGSSVAHLHMGDAKGVDGEGLQIGEGEIDFAALGRVLDRVCPGVPFIPEIWQGHKNAGEGFWLALQRLEGKL
jgi:N-acetylneuraminate synthase